jgi:DNA-binding LacI/PurR family transcriptional regulator
MRNSAAMPNPRTSAAPLPAGRGVAELEAAVRELVRRERWNPATPLPTTRELGARFGVSNASACRVFQRLEAEKTLWHGANRRYYSYAARKIHEGRKPYACLVRRLQSWSHMYQSLMGGFSAAFGRQKTGMLIVHDEGLVRHADTTEPPVHADVRTQREALREFFHDHEAQFAGILFDDVWRDDALREFAPQLRNAVVVCRPTALGALSSVCVDFDASAVKALGHLFARGYEEIVIAVPFANSAPVDLMHAATLKVAAGFGAPVPAKNVCSAATAADRRRLMARLKAARRRTGVFCLEDNVSLLLQSGLHDAGIDCPGSVGLLSGMGDIVARLGISSIKIDYEAIGRTAAQILVAGEHRHVRLPSELVVGATT